MKELINGLAIKGTAKGRAKSSRVSLVILVRSFFRWLQERGSLVRDPSRCLPLPDDGEEDLPAAPFSEAEVCALLASLPRRSVVGLRNACIMKLLYGCGLRRSEALALDVVDVDLSRRTLWIHGKGGQDRMLPQMGTATAALRDWLSLRRTLRKPVTEDHLPIKSISTARMPVILAGAWYLGTVSGEPLGFTTHQKALPEVRHRDLMFDLGLTPELAGRVNGVAVLAPHTKASLLEILDESRASPWSSIKHLTGMELTIEPSASEILAEVPIRRGLGARFLATACHRVAEKLAFLPKEELPATIPGAWLLQQVVPH